MNDDKKLKLNDILHLTKNQIENTKIGLNMGWQGRTHFLDWYESDPNDRNTDFTYTLLEIFPKNTQPARIYARENYWKDVFKTRTFGYNKN